MSEQFSVETFKSDWHWSPPSRGISPERVDLQRPVTLSFRRHRVFPEARQLFCGGQAVEIGGRAFDLLVVLLSARGQVVTKDELVRQVWPSTIVDESNLRFQMALLRRALGDDRDLIKTVSGRGYLFAAEPESGAAAGEPEGGLAFRDFEAAGLDGELALEDRGVDINATARLAQLEAENTKLRRAVANLAKDRVVLVMSQSDARAWLSVAQASPRGLPLSQPLGGHSG